MKFLKSLNKRYNELFNITFCKEKGFFKYDRFDKKIYIRHPKHFVVENEIKWVCENIYYKYYLPKENDTVVDLGAGYGEEAVYLFSKSPKINFFGVEIQPVMYECISNTLNELSENFKCSPLAIMDEEELFLSSQLNYAGVGKVPEKGYIEIPTINWNNYLKKYNIKKIDLLKMNIEGAERDILKQITDFSVINRMIISCHDFRADNGDGEFFRTKEFVIKTLEKNGYELKYFGDEKDWVRDWVYAEKKI